MLCYSDAQISMQGTVYFLGYTIGSLLWMRLSDSWGRRRMVIGGLFLFLFTLTIYFLQMSDTTVKVTLFLFGVDAPLIVLISYVLIFESVPQSHRAFTTALTFLFDSLSSFYLPLIYEFGKNWWILIWIDLVTALLLLVPLFFVVK